MNKEILIKNMDLVSQVLSEDYDLVHFTPESIHTQNNIMGVLCKADTSFAASIRGIELVKLLKKMPGEEVELKSTDKFLQVKGGGLNAKFRKYPDKTKEPPDYSKLNFVDISNDFLDGVNCCLPSVSDKEIQGVLTGMHIADNKIVSCNNITVTEYTMEKSTGMVFTLPKIMAKVVEDFRPVLMCIDNNKVVFTNADKTVFIWSVLMAGKYPMDNMVKLLDCKGEEYTLPKEAGGEALTTSLFSFDAEDGTSFVGVDIKDKEVVLSGNKSFGSLENAIEHKSDKQFKFYIDPGVLTRALGINTTFNHCGNYITFKNKNIRHLVCLVQYQ
jgi:hypothetical protein